MYRCICTGCYVMTGLRNWRPWEDQPTTSPSKRKKGTQGTWLSTWIITNSLDLDSLPMFILQEHNKSFLTTTPYYREVSGLKRKEIMSKTTTRDLGSHPALHAHLAFTRDSLSSSRTLILPFQKQIKIKINHHISLSLLSPRVYHFWDHDELM